MIAWWLHYLGNYDSAHNPIRTKVAIWTILQLKHFREGLSPALNSVNPLNCKTLSLGERVSSPFSVYNSVNLLETVYIQKSFKLKSWWATLMFCDHGKMHVMGFEFGLLPKLGLAWFLCALDILEFVCIDWIAFSVLFQSLLAGIQLKHCVHYGESIRDDSVSQCLEAFSHTYMQLTQPSFKKTQSECRSHYICCTRPFIA